MKSNHIELLKQMIRKSRRSLLAVSTTGLLLGAIVTTGAPRILSDYFTWSPKIFAVDPNVIAEVVDQMRLEGDTVLKEIEADTPGFAIAFTTRTAKFSSVAMNSIILPKNVIKAALYDQSQASTAGEDDTSRLGYIIGKTVKNLMIFAIENTLATLSDPSKPMAYKFKVCEQNPTMTSHPCDLIGIQPSYNFLKDDSREYIFARRVVSHPLFVERMCPTAKSFATWLMNFGWAPGYDTPAEKMILLKTFFNQLDTELQDLKSGLQTPRKKNGPLPLDPAIGKFLLRGMWDGGVPWVDAVATCSQQIQQEFLTQSTATSPIAESKIMEILPLRIAGMPDSSAVVPAFEPAQVYRLIRTIDAASPLPENIYINFKGMMNENLLQNNERVEYLDTISGIAYIQTTPEVLHFLSTIDVKNRYSAMTESAFTEMTKFNPGLFDVDEVFCVMKEPLVNPVNRTTIRYLVHTMGKLQTVNPGNADLCFPYIDDKYTSLLYFMRRPR